MLNQSQQIAVRVKVILRDHGLTLAKSDDGYIVINKSPFSGTHVNRYRSLVQVVDYYKPILKDDRLTALYN